MQKNKRAMKKIIIALLYILINSISIMAQNPQLKGLNVLLSKDSEKSVYLTAVYETEPTKTEKTAEDVEFILHYQIRRDIATGLQQFFEDFTAKFIRQDSVKYKIIESGYISDWWYRETLENGVWQPMSFESFMGDYLFVGYSTDKNLYAVKALAYLNKQIKKYSDE
ncbi:hypothetical protein FACS189464_2140 [Bacteroidia bacterium]|nr:hypothetical protein FACS189464_2140 [Bacteroidia bacterium]